jgi:class 3 adenylate cyclase
VILAEGPGGGPESGLSAAQWLDAVRDAERRGELLLAVDLAERGLGEHPEDLWLRYRAVLALARSGSTAEAAKRFAAYGLGAEADEEDIGALGARIAKDEALGSGAAERSERARRAAEDYRRVFDQTGGYYPAVNAATLMLVAGDSERARELAREVLRLLGELGDDSYYAAATESEAWLILGEEGGAREALGRAARLHGDDFGAVSTTRRQLRLVCELSGLDPAILAVLAGPAVVHYCGHRIARAGEDGRFPAEAEQAAAAQVAAEVAQHPARYAYGSLAAGGDILWAEALLASGCELHVVLPFAMEEFVRCSVEPSGGDWVERFHRCVEAAREVRFTTDDAFLDDDVLYRYGAEYAMGLTLLRARYLAGEARQFALWDGGPAHGAAGAAIDIATWRRGERAISIVSPARPGEATAAEKPTISPPERERRRVVRAMLFADVRGFSKLTDEELPRFAEHFLGAFARILERHSGRIGHKNTWGDALYVVLDDVESAAACALDLQEAVTELDLSAKGLPEHLALRLGAHVGPVFPTRDPVTDQLAFMGSHVSRTARIEPVTPPGVVYVTAPFAAALTLSGAEGLGCDYVGHMPAAKDFGRMRMYRLRRRSSVLPSLQGGGN